MRPLLRVAGAPLLLPLLLVVAAAAPAAATRGRDADVVIVGGGTAGCTLAARLCTALPSLRIVLLERGARRNATEEFLVRSPRQAIASWALPSLVEAFPTAPERHLGGRRVEIIVGATLGGGSAVNIGQWTQPLAGAVSAWGVAGLDDAAAARHFRRAARQLRVAVPPAGLRQAYAAEWLAAAARAGLPPVSDDAAGGQPDRGAWLHRLTADAAGRRRDACTAYVAPALRGACGHNLRVAQEVTVTKLTWDDGDGGGRRRRRHAARRVTGVAYVDSADRAAARPQTLRARVAVVSTAGATGSPKLLQLSGVGPRDALRRAGVTPRVDLPVGVGFQTRPLLGINYEYDGVPLAVENNATVLASRSARRRWEAGRGGVLGVAAQAALARVPDGDGGYVSATFTPAAAAGEPTLSSFCMTNPSSSGRLVVASADPFATPVVETNLLGDGREVRTLLACLRRMVAVGKAFPRAFGLRETAPGPARRLDEAYVRGGAGISGHMVGGCPVGGVLDGRLRVRGFRNLYVVDSSAIPSIPPSAGSMASVYVLAEFAAAGLVRAFRKAAAGGV